VFVVGPAGRPAGPTTNTTGREIVIISEIGVKLLSECFSYFIVYTIRVIT
jgi:hypothetical protein